MFYVYLLRSIPFPRQTYIGYSADLKTRFADHNAGRSPHTSKFKPWSLVSYHAFADRQTARAFERYLKSGSGQAFARKRFWSAPADAPFSRCP